MGILGSLRPKRGSTHNSKRIGRGRGSGKGGTATKGHKGQKARTGGTVRRGFEGGQSPMARRLPKFGFTNASFKTVYQIVNLEQLNRFDGDVTPETLKLAGLVGKGLVKILARGDLKKPLSIKAHKVSEKAKAAIESAGGKIEVI
ncbi:MAG: 50S ribosomal protein L15 [Bdellovibrionales bacterium]|jgi:large subunit ribosomal protein L15|nr:50S ribosomal protein L15 [Bdellovibrionales bacterium]MBK9041514.1 50S ribosomal protein L15 [Bdellovibrionales bacterium]